MFAAFEQIFGANQQVAHAGGSDQEARSPTGSAAQFRALAKLANGKTHYGPLPATS
jgi:hypothetical protein